MNITLADEYDFKSVRTPVLHKLYESAERTWHRRFENVLNQTEAIHAMHDELRRRGEIK